MTSLYVNKLVGLCISLLSLFPSPPRFVFLVSSRSNTNFYEKKPITFKQKVCSKVE